MFTQVVQWGNSLAVRLPKVFAEEVGLKKNDPVELSVKEDAIWLRRSKPLLDSLVSGISPENRHRSLWPDEKIKGKEVW